MRELQMVALYKWHAAEYCDEGDMTCGFSLQWGRDLTPEQ